MARFDVYRFPKQSVPLVVDVQAEILDQLASRVVIPLVLVSLAREEALPRLKPILSIEGRDYLLMTTDISALPISRLGERVTNIEDPYRDEITKALDFLLTGF
ncbi:MAG: CcdB family protein [Pseudomonadota bacterium]